MLPNLGESPGHFAANSEKIRLTDSRIFETSIESGSCWGEDPVDGGAALLTFSYLAVL